MVVAAGRRSVTEPFPRDAGRSPYDRPQRLLAAGLYRGLDLGTLFSYNISGGAGEIFCAPMMTREAIVPALLVEAIPGGPLEPVTRVPWHEVGATLLGLLREHAPRLAEVADPAAFELLGPDDLLQGAVTPTVRRPVAELPSGRIALAVGDAWIVNDPITGQGANLGSRCAWIAAEAIAAGGPYDAAFARATADRMWEARQAGHRLDERVPAAAARARREAARGRRRQAGRRRSGVVAVLRSAVRVEVAVEPRGDRPDR
ncbi:hypothetical protein GCM10020220_059190 [Nonomuraea rubra]